MEAEKEHVKTERSKREIEEKLKEEIESAKVSTMILRNIFIFSDSNFRPRKT